jgi:hypothetical protein|tara:strand:+ start:230 stop:835 length:606 start_codon:yes stop_codon:yes gene_type:complete
MTNRKKKLRITQISLIVLGTLIIFFTYYNREINSSEKILSKELQVEVEKQLTENSKKGDVFYNIEYSGLDMVGNRYTLKSKQAFTQKENQEVVNMEVVEAVFYFKNDTVLYVWSDEGIYNNKTLDMKFFGNVKANYDNSELFAEKAEYSNSKSYLIISENVKINDIRGTVVADKLLFDIKKQKLNIASFNNGKINAKVNLK